MRRVLPALLAAMVVAAIPATSSGQVFTLVRGGQQPLPSYTVPNGPTSIRVPFNMSRPPARPEVRSHDQLLALWKRAGDGYGVPWQVLGAINKIESNFGQNMGPSSAGALGWMQFIPSSWMRWGMDGDGNGIADPWNPEDAVYAAARYLAAAGAHDDLERAIFAYNHAQWYVDDVLELAETFGDGGLAGAAPQLAYPTVTLEERIADARRRVARISQTLERSGDDAERLAWRRLRVERLAGDPNIPGPRFRELDAELRRLEAVEEAAEVRRLALQDTLAEAVSALDDLQAEQAAAALAVPEVAERSARPAVDGWVFPVGGGPDRVSVAHTHHDYPAADIAAPEGSPLYALAESVVTETYPEGDGKCGIGLQLRVSTGELFVYCHLSYLEPGIAPGAALAAGAPVGLVGSTGNSTGPHLHLAFVPSVAYPQEEAWFRSFAGIAYSWQDAPTPERTRAMARAGLERRQAIREPVFRVLRTTRVVRFTTSGG
jgi:murein DD-endopeptidase MepM/ murein hydrolase activator NlpD